MKLKIEGFLKIHQYSQKVQAKRVEAKNVAIEQLQILNHQKSEEILNEGESI